MCVSNTQTLVKNTTKIKYFILTAKTENSIIVHVCVCDLFLYVHSLICVIYHLIKFILMEYRMLNAINTVNMFLMHSH